MQNLNLEMTMAANINFHELSKLGAAQRQKLCTRTEADLADFEAKVKPILEAIADEGDVALARFAREFDKAPVEAGDIAATKADFAAAEKSLAPDVRAALEFAAKNIRKFHEDQKPEEMWLHEISPGSFAGDRTTPIPSVACYVPRGKGAFPSSVLMLAIPAKVAGVENICVITPPGPDGKIDDATLVAASTQTIPRMSKVVGPGSPWVAAAKRLLSHVLDTGSPAGPSEVIVLADSTSNGRLAALDLLIECEHGSDSSGYLVTWDRRVAEEAMTALPELMKDLSVQRAGYVSDVLSGNMGGVVLARDEADAIAFCNEYAPEHLQILSKEPFQYLGQITNAGEILLGEHTPSVLGNYVIGANHVLPTAGWARTASAISVFDFMKRTSIAYVTAKGYPELAKHASVLAKYEGFDGHANAVSAKRDQFLKT
jgi:histidinol dehydrogenase